MAQSIKKSEEKEITLNVLFYEEDGLVIAHCLEFDVVAAADTEEGARKEIIALMCTQIDYAFGNNNLENLFQPAPPEIWQRFFACKEQGHELHKIRSGFNSPLRRPDWLKTNTCIDYQKACYV